MAPRANWKGFLRLSLVSCPIALYPASSLREKVSFNRINRKTGNRLKQQNVDSETGKVVSREDSGADRLWDTSLKGGLFGRRVSQEVQKHSSSNTAIAATR